MRSIVLALFALPLLAPSSFAQDQPPEVDMAEVLRMGDVVQYLGGETASGELDVCVSVMGPPTSDADKWFISVLTMRGCAACTKLKQDWQTDQWLLALANPNDPKKSWAHYNVYDKDDQSQAFRFQNIKVTAFPTILVQPPRSGKYGNPSTVVFQQVYKGSPQQLARDITQAIRAYVAKLQSPPPSNTARDEGQESYISQLGSDPPWLPAPRVDPILPGPNTPTPDPTIPPQYPAPLATFPWSAVITLLFAGFSLPAVIALVVWALSFIRERRKETGKPQLLNQESFDRLIQLLQQLADAQTQTSKRNE